MNYKKSSNQITVLYFGTYDPEYSRNRVLIDGLRENGVEVVECRDDSLGLKKFWKLFLKLRQIKKEYDAVVIGFFGPLMVAFAKIITRKPVIFDPLVFLYDTNVMDRKVTKPGTFRAFYYWFLDWLNLRLADMILLDTEEHIKYASKEFGVKANKFKKLLIGTREDIYHPMANNSENKKFLVEFHGIFNTLQGVEFIIQAAKKLESREDIKFIIIGGGKDKVKHFKLAEDLKVKNIEFISPVDKKELAFKISQSDVCLGIFGVSEKAKRVIPNKVYECVAMKKPVISADTPAIREFFTDDDLTLVKIADAEAIARAILKLKDNKELMEKLANNAYEKLVSNASTKILGLKFKEIIKELIHQN